MGPAFPNPQISSCCHFLYQGFNKMLYQEQVYSKACRMCANCDIHNNYRQSHLCLYKASKRLGSQQSPVLSIEPDRIVIDELHLLLRIGDVPIRNLVFELVQTGRRGTNTISTLCSAMWGHLPSMGMQRPLWQAIRQVRLYISYGRRYEKGHQSLVITFQFLIEERHQ